MIDSYATVETYIDNLEQAREIAHAVVDGGLSATSHIEHVFAYYRWNGKTVDAEEYRLSFDVPARFTAEVVATIQELHPYDLPFISTRPMRPAGEEAATWLEEERFPDISQVPKKGYSPETARLFEGLVPLT